MANATATKKPTVADKLLAIVAEVKALTIERDVEADLIARSLVSRSHGCLIGPPGTAKSLLIREFVGHVTDAQMFEVLLAKDTPSEQVLGPPSLPALKKEEYRRVTRGKLPEANVAFLDEIFKANSTVLNAMLAIINERIFHNNGGVQVVPLDALFGASNELPGPDREDLNAFRDRFAWTKVVEHVRTSDGVKSVIHGQLARNRGTNIAGSHTTITLAELRSLQTQAANVKVSDQVITALVELRQRAESENLRISVRRMFEGVKLMQAAAALTNRDACSTEDIKVFEHVLWTDPEDHGTAYELTLEYAGAIAKKASRLRSSFEELQRTLNELQAEAPTDGTLPDADLMGRVGSVSTKLKRMDEQITTAIGEAKDEGHETSELDHVQANVAAAREGVKKLLGIGS